MASGRVFMQQISEYTPFKDNICVSKDIRGNTGRDPFRSHCIQHAHAVGTNGSRLVIPRMLQGNSN